MSTGANYQVGTLAETGTSQSVTVKFIAEKNSAEITALDTDTVQTGVTDTNGNMMADPEHRIYQCNISLGDPS